MEATMVRTQPCTGTAQERALAKRMQQLLGPEPGIPCAFTFASGYRLTLGQGSPEFEVAICTPRGLAALRSLDELRICEAYMDGDLNFTGDLRQAVRLRQHLHGHNVWITLWRLLQPLLIGRHRAHAKWVQNHYDLDNIQLYYLDHDYHTYTPGVFVSEEETLEAASERKHRLAFEGTNVQPGDRILDVGFGWGSFLRYATRRGVHVTGLTLSRQQLHFVQDEIVKKEHLDAELIYTDFFQYQPQEPFDAIVLLGAIEELADYQGVMERLACWVKPGKRVYLDFMAATRGFIFPAFISKYIYQGRTSRVYLPKFLKAVTRSPFEILALYNDRRNYYLTTNQWFENFERNQQAVRERFGERLYRMFRLYLAGNPVMLDHPSHLTTAYRVLLELPADYQR